MNESGLKEKETLMQAFERLEQTLYKLKNAAELTFLLNQKLNRTETNLTSDDNDKKKDETIGKNIVELFNFIAEKMETQIINIGNNTERSLKMID